MTCNVVRNCLFWKHLWPLQLSQYGVFVYTLFKSDGMNNSCYYGLKPDIIKWGDAMKQTNIQPDGLKCQLCLTSFILCKVVSLITLLMVAFTNNTLAFTVAFMNNILAFTVAFMNNILAFTVAYTSNKLTPANNKCGLYKKLTLSFTDHKQDTGLHQHYHQWPS